MARAIVEEENELAVSDNSWQKSWLEFHTTLEEYVEPGYYDRLLQPYECDAGSDLDLLEAAVRRSRLARPLRRVLELGCGTGRATEALLSSAEPECYVGVDLSGQMVDWCRARYRGDARMKFVQSDSLDFLVATDQRFDFITSLWSFSHSVHQNMRQQGGRSAVCDTIRRVVEDLLTANGTFYVIHFDSLSEEQRILVRQWNRVLPIFEPDQQSPSKQILDEVVAELDRTGRAEARVTHYRGRPIQYQSLDHALETFMNFHLEGFFNDRNDLTEVLVEVREYLSGYQQPDGSIEIRPSWFAYEINSVPG